jgi:enoyl-CoA hydratase/carnithine racemase
MPNHFILDKEGGLATLTFNRPEKRNPLNEEILLELNELLCQLRDDADVRVLILTGTGNTSVQAPTVAGERNDRPARREKIFAEFAPRRTRLVERVLATLVNLELITIAAVNGYAVGGGWALVLGCDIRIAVAEAEFWFPEVDLGAPLSPSMIAMLNAHVGPSRTQEIILTCRRYTAPELRSLNLLNQVVAKEALVSTIASSANSLLKKNPMR